MRDLSGIKAVFFDFDDTLAIQDHEFEIVNYWEKVWAQPDNVYDESVMPNEGIRLFLEELSGVAKYCITWADNSLVVEVKQAWLDKNFPGEFKKTICTATPEEKIRVMQVYASVFGLEPEEILFVDDLWSTIVMAKKAGFVVMTPQEIMNSIIKQFV